jgi:hypothetical protein
MTHLLYHVRPSALGAFVLGGEDDEDILPLVYMRQAATFHLAVFHALNSTLCLLLDHVPATTKFYSEFGEAVGPPLADLSADLTHAVMTKASGGAGGPSTVVNGGDLSRFLYFNATNMAVTRSAASSQDEGAREKLVKLAADFISDLRRSGRTEGEVSAKLASEEWLVVQVAGARTIIVLLQEKNLNLLEVAEEVAKLKKSSFDNICML